VSDGQVHVEAQRETDWNRRQATRGMRCYSVLLGDQAGAVVLARVSDALVTVADLTDDNAALQVLFGF
jgi:3-oxoacyl-[acyl-carrier-protein] synthase III